MIFAGHARSFLHVIVFTLRPQYMQVTYTPDEPQLFWKWENPEDSQFKPHAGIKMAQVLMISGVYLWGGYSPDNKQIP